MKRNKLSQLLWERLPEGTRSRWWMAHAYFNYAYNQRLMVIYPFHWLVQFCWWLNYRWNVHRHRQSWIDHHTNRQLSYQRDLHFADLSAAFKRNQP